MTGKTYLVGGAVRDMLLGFEPKDCDYVVVGSSPQQMLNLGFTQVGADFPVFLHPTTGEEHALARVERKTGAGYNGFEVDFDSSVTLEQDLFRRDLTINSMAIDQATGVIVDPYGGQEDLKNKILRHTSDAFAEDPVRVLRIARFAARYKDFRIHESTLELMSTIIKSGEFDSLTPERVFAEFKKGLMESKPSEMFYVLAQVGCQTKLKEFFDPHPGRLTALDEAASLNECLEIRFAIIGGGFLNQAHYKKWTISSECEELSSLLNNNLQSLIEYEHMDVEQKLQLFNRVDIFRRLSRFRNMMNAAIYVTHHRIPPKQITTQLMIDASKVMLVNGGNIAQTIDDKTKIKEAISAARRAALERP